MFNLKATADKLQVITASAGTIDVHTSWILNSSTNSLDRNNPTQITTAATTDIVAAASGTDVKNIKFCSIRNAHATVANAITVQHTDGTNVPTIIKTTLYPGDSLHYNELSGWKYVPASSSIIVPGRLLLSTIKTTGTSFTTGALTNKLRARGVAGGGGGAGNTSVAASAGAGGGGGGGGFMDILVAVAPSTAYTYAIGAAGAANSGASGGNGGDTTLTVGATTYTAKGGTGATTVANNTTVTAAAGGAGGVVGTNADINASGWPGEPGIVLIVATPILASGNGGSCLYGAGGLGLTAAGAGNAGTGNGSGGSGAATGASAARSGGAGTVGLIQFDEYS